MVGHGRGGLGETGYLCLVPADKFHSQKLPCGLLLKEFADNSFKFVENGRKLSKQVGNTMRKGEITCNK